MAEVIVVMARQDPQVPVIQRLISKAGAGNARVTLIVAEQAGRARQMNRGASIAESETLLFIHADTRLPAAADDFIADSLKTSGWGRFDLRLDDPRPVFKILSWFINHRSRLTHICTGDQALFMTRDFHRRLGGFPDQELMEDIEFSIQAKKKRLARCDQACRDHLRKALAEGRRG